MSHILKLSTFQTLTNYIVFELHFSYSSIFYLNDYPFHIFDMLFFTLESTTKGLSLASEPCCINKLAVPCLQGNLGETWFSLFYAYWTDIYQIFQNSSNRPYSWSLALKMHTEHRKATKRCHGNSFLTLHLDCVIGQIVFSPLAGAPAVLKRSFHQPQQKNTDKK